MTVLPFELGLMILGNVKEPREVRTCKLVCKRWKYMMEIVFDHTYEDNTPFRFNFTKGYIEEATRLLEACPTMDVSDNGCEIFTIACEKGYTRIVELLLQHPSTDPTVQSNAPIRMAQCFGHVEVMKLLINDPRVDPSVLDNTCLYWAVIDGQEEIIRLLLRDRRVIAHPYTINIACNYQEPTILRLLLDSGRARPSRTEYERAKGKGWHEEANKMKPDVFPMFDE